MTLAALLLTVETLTWAGVPASVQPSIADSAAQFQTLITSIERDTTERLRRGAFEDFTYFVLQSRSFTSLPPIEPAVSAKEFHDNGERVPAAVQARLAAFKSSRIKPDPRLTWFRAHAPADPVAAYTEAMRFLYEKEFAGAKDSYRHRGHSPDTRPEASLSVWTALGVIKSTEPERRIRRVLIVGPGVDWAPRTAFRDSIAPQSYQPALVHDALVEWQLAAQNELEIVCADINPLVLEFAVKPPIAEALPPLTLDSAHRDFESFARRALTSTVPRRISAEKLNILTSHFNGERFDLVVITNVFPYFAPREQALALVNIHAMLAPGGYLIHNEPSGNVETISRALKMAPLHARSIRIAPGTRAPLLDAFMLHRKD